MESPLVEKLEHLLAPQPRVRIGRPGKPDPEGRCIVYWMQRAQRGVDNPALNLAIDVGNALGLPVLAIFGLTAEYPGAQKRHYQFLLEGLRDAEADLRRRGVELTVRIGPPDEVVAAIADLVLPALVVSDENPVRIGALWRSSLAQRLRVPFYLVDADVVVPTSLFPREEYAARTIRPKIHKVWEDYLQPFPTPAARVKWRGTKPPGEPLDPDGLLNKLHVQGVGPVNDYKGGYREAMRRLHLFVKERLPRYATQRNQPAPYVTSELSAHLHFGHISPLTIALEVMASGAPRECIDVYLEELVVRRELAINFVARNPDYDSLNGCPEWARSTLAKHAGDPRPILYNRRQLEAGETHDTLWNAAQKEMVHTGRMHNYLRMYWAKKILEWSSDPETAYAIALDLNDRFEMDGRDPNGYTGVAWAIGGKHDRPWPERPIFGTIRFMSNAGVCKKIDAGRYIAWVESIDRGLNDQPFMLST